ncbi:23S rRNA (adenine(1618)-N(6))-methyltransferase RlmF [Flavobacterium agrisoli]|uniref:Ribosomal RNA large subunit methyltransferase F n=1 Tax=Flavobacterium agrisoli TaxID=2793066 RepID=A0A934PN26_9FLAO|nr:23S rRNA (adenine(1618)-N(6))-methyltransferase RlmF [Flavobacterium agrisoli]MBK0369844.1 23S rRNA (adenine(1618)-N(6))-methyltransferase RlmF [Flavobacterium agrisoli]
MKETNKITKSNLHPRNLHSGHYDFEELVKQNTNLKSFVFTNNYQITTIDFSNPTAVKELNKALLQTFYNIENWDIPHNYLCPPIPGRADYIHYIADLLAESNNGIIPKGANVTGLDIGVGANCIYPILGNALYGWHFVGTDIDAKALKNSAEIINNNAHLVNSINLRLQSESRFIFKNNIDNDSRFSFVLCNPPFHKSAEEATKGTLRKIRNLNSKKTTEKILNFGGKSNELWCEGGELKFITDMIYESRKFKTNCLWFTCLVSKKENLKRIYNVFKKVEPNRIKTIEMAQGNKVSRFVAWTFLNEAEHQNWKI